MLILFLMFSWLSGRRIREGGEKWGDVKGERGVGRWEIGAKSEKVRLGQ